MKRLRRVAHRIAAAWRTILVAILILIAVHAAWDYAEARRLRTALDEWGAVSNRHATRAAPPQPHLDAAAYYLAAQALMPDATRVSDLHGRMQREIAREAVTADTLAAVGALLKSHEDALRLFDRATALEFAGFVPDRFPLFSAARARQLASLRTTHLAFTGAAGDAAAQAALAAIVLERRSRAPISRYESLSWSLSWHSTMPRDLEAVLARTQPSETVLAQLAAALETLDDDRELTRFLVACAEQDIRLYRGRLRDIDGSLGSVGFTATPEVGLWDAVFRPLVARDLTRLLRQYPRVLEAAVRPWPERIEAVVAASTPAWNLKGAAWPFTNIVYPPSHWIADDDDTRLQARLTRFFAGSLALTRAARAAIAVERHRRAHDGQLPDSLDALVPTFLPGTPVDPFSGRAIQFARTSDGYAVYGVGSNGTDEGGAELRAPLMTPMSGAERMTGDLGLAIVLSQPPTR
jgi:hypothetical protein